MTDWTLSRTYDPGYLGLGRELDREMWRGVRDHREGGFRRRSEGSARTEQPAKSLLSPSGASAAPSKTSPSPRGSRQRCRSLGAWGAAQKGEARPNGRAFFSRGYLSSGLWSQVQPVLVAVDHDVVEHGIKVVMDGVRVGNRLAGDRARRVLDPNDDRN